MHKHVYTKESGLAKYQFFRETIDAYSCGKYNGMLDLDPFTPLEKVTQGLLFHEAVTNVFPPTTGNAPKSGIVIQNIWYDEECHDIRRCLQHKVTLRI